MYGWLEATESAADELDSLKNHGRKAVTCLHAQMAETVHVTSRVIARAVRVR